MQWGPEPPDNEDVGAFVDDVTAGVDCRVTAYHFIFLRNVQVKVTVNIQTPFEW